MDTSAFSAPTGRLVRTVERSMAFVPAPLPPALDLGAIALSMADAMQAIGELKGACRRLQNPFMLVRPLQRREALTSSAMEGTFTSEDNLILAEAGVEPARDESTREVVNYLTALTGSLQRLQTLPISHRILREAHATLLSGLSAARGARKRPGEYKTEQNWIGGYTIDRARFVPPPPNESQICMDDLELYINRDESNRAKRLLDLALVHYQMETIHPFADGNGRVGRMLISLMAVHHGLLDTPVLYVSPALERQKDTYIDLMFDVSTKGHWTEWLSFFFSIIVESCQEAVATVDRLVGLHDEYRRTAMTLGRSASAARLVDRLFEVPVISITDAADRLDMTYPAAKSAIERLVSAGILVERQGRYPRLFLAPRIIRASAPPASP